MTRTKEFCDQSYFKNVVTLFAWQSYFVLPVTFVLCIAAFHEVRLADFVQRIAHEQKVRG
jgi:hypothetical protein